MNQVHHPQTLRGKSGLYCLVAALAIFVNLLILGCNYTLGTFIADLYDPENFLVASYIKLNGPSTVAPGDTVRLNLSAEWEGEAPGEFTWSPPRDATEITFGALQPEPGGPPYVFKNVTKAQAYSGLDVSFKIPTYKLDGEELIYFRAANGGRGSVSQMTIRVSGASSAPPRVEPLPRSGASSAQSALALRADNLAWRLQGGHMIEEPFSQQDCLDIAEQIHTDNVFTTWRLPLADQIVPGISYRLPVVLDAPANPPQLTLMSGPLNATLPLEINPASSAWSNENLPSAPGETWVAFTASPGATLNCPVMGEMPALNLVTDFSLDLSSRPNGCADCILSAYVCYKTGSGTLPLNSLAARLAADASSLSADGVTCLGPNLTQLSNSSAWWYEGWTISQLLKPGDPIAIHYWVENLSTTTPLTLTLAPASTLPGASWVIHPAQAGNVNLPDTSQTVGSAITVPASGAFHLHILSTVPAGTAPGDYQYALTLSNASVSPASWKRNTALKVTADGSLPGPADTTAGVELSGQASAPLAQPGKNLTYYLSIQNTGAQPLTGLVLADTLPSGTTFVSCAGGDSCEHSGDRVTWNLASLAIGYNHVMTLVVKVDAGLLPGTVLHNSTYSVQTGQGVSSTGAVIDTPLASFFDYLPRVSRP